MGESIKSKITRLVTKKRVERKIIGIPAKLFIFLLIISSVFAATTIFKTLTRTVNVQAAGDLTTAMPDTVQIVGGDIITYEFTIDSNSKTTTDMSVTFRLSHSNLENGEAKIQILDSSNVILKETESVVNNELTITHIFPDIPAQSTKSAKVRMQFATTADSGSYTVTLELRPENFDFEI